MKTIALQFIKHSLRVIKRDKKLLTFPLIGALLRLIIFAFALIPVIAHIELSAWKQHIISIPFFISFLLLFYFLNIIGFVFNGALISCAAKHFQAQPYSLSCGFKIMPRLFLKAIIWIPMVTLGGNIIRLIEWYREKEMGGLRGNRWLIAGFFASSIMAIENSYPISALKKSAVLISQTWGVALYSRLRIRSMFLLARLIALMPALISIGSGDKMIVFTGSIMSAILFLMISVFNSATRVISNCALYEYARGKLYPHYFDEALLKNAFLNHADSGVANGSARASKRRR